MEDMKEHELMKKVMIEAVKEVGTLTVEMKQPELHSRMLKAMKVDGFSEIDGTYQPVVLGTVFYLCHESGGELLPEECSPICLLGWMMAQYGQFFHSMKLLSEAEFAFEDDEIWFSVKGAKIEFLSKLNQKVLPASSARND